jgi:nucleoside-diphosphate-sugar epimerase
MKVLFIGGTGNISRSVSLACCDRGIDLFLLTRGMRQVDIPGATLVRGDIHHPETIGTGLKDQRWDAVVDWIAYTVEDVEREIALFRGRTRQFVFISSASAYQKPPLRPFITESTPLSNPFWEYSRQKIACEERLHRAYREEGFPITIVRPSHTYDTMIPVAISGGAGYTAIDRMKKGRPIIVHGDGTSLWTLTHAEDFARGFVGLLGHPGSIGEAFHITSDESLTWNQIHQELAHAWGCEAKLVHVPSDFIAACQPSLGGTLLGDKAHSVIFDNTKIKRLVPEFIATIPFHLGIRKTMAWFEADPVRQVVKPETHAMMDRILQAYARASLPQS